MRNKVWIHSGVRGGRGAVGERAGERRPRCIRLAGPREPRRLVVADRGRIGPQCEGLARQDRRAGRIAAVREGLGLPREQ